MMSSDGQSAAPADPETILVVDSEVLIRLVIAQYLRECGFKVVEAVSGDEAMQILQSADVAVDIVLSDATVQGTMDGFGLARWVRQNKPDIGVILVASPNAAADAAADLCESGPLLSRPYEPQIVIERIRRLLAGRKPGGK
jgi:CheY-like chemotaxis protein